MKKNEGLHKNFFFYLFAALVSLITLWWITNVFRVLIQGSQLSLFPWIIWTPFIVMFSSFYCALNPPLLSYWFTIVAINILARVKRSSSINNWLIRIRINSFVFQFLLVLKFKLLSSLEGVFDPFCFIEQNSWCCEHFSLLGGVCKEICWTDDDFASVGVHSSFSLFVNIVGLMHIG